MPKNTSIVYYRVKLISNDGRVKLSNTVVIVLPTENTSLVVAPNPVSSAIRAIINSKVDEIVNWKVIDFTGKIVKNGTVSIKKSSNQLLIDAATISKGMYHIQVIGSSINCKTKFVKI